ncbi:MAG: MOSC domain-containing protein [Opitutae bacterium]|nr:MOSC domain-containing protein [Opitutae bacterium]
MHLSGLFIHPVKSCRGLAVPSAGLDDYGLIGDRRFMVVNEADGLFLTQRSHPRMALIETSLTPDTLILSAPKHGSISVPRASSPTPHASIQRRITVWKSTTAADDCGDEAAEWLSGFLGGSLRLVRMGGTFQRPIVKPTAQPGDVVSFADGYPFLVVSEASLADLNSRLKQPLPMNRFRPNLVVAGCAAFAEDAWTKIRIGEIVFRNAGPCARCPITATDQETAERGKEPLKTLATYRRDPDNPTDVNFGVNLIHETKRGTVHVGDAVQAI